MTEAILYCYALWLLFLAVMALKAVWKSLPMATKVLAVPGALVAFAMDVGLQLAATIPLFDLPREWTFSKRMGRYLQGSGWRRRFACAVCRYLLDPFEVGGHCRR